MSTITLTAKGQVTIPKEIRQRLGLEAGARLRVDVDANGAIVVQPEDSARPKTGRSRVPGLLRHLARNRPVSIEEMNEAIADEAVARFRRATRK